MDKTVLYSEIRQGIEALLEDLDSAKEAHLNGFKIDKQLGTIADKHDLMLQDLNSIDFDA